tara:strand:- start:6853 stop:9894 length:3042 start_codon:yes stop_codon:yes gene_type:complete
MARYTNVATNFSGGLITDNLVGRTDLPRTANSCRKLENFFPSLQGPAEYRQGFEVTTVDSAYASENYVRQTTVILATAKNYRVVFGNLFLKIYDAESNVLKDTVTTPYTTNQLADLRFSSETDVLYIAHEQHRPRKLTANISFEFFNLRSVGFNDGGTPNDLSDDVINDPPTFDNLRAADGPDADSLPDQLRAQVPLAGDDDWTLAEIDTYIEPFLEKDTSDIQLTATKGQEIVKLEKQGAFTVIKSDWDGGTANQFSQDWYVEYDVGGVTVAGKVIASATGIYANDVQPPTNDCVYVDAFDFVTDIKDASALLQLIDNTGNDARYIKDGVPNGDIHLRSDTTVLNGSQHGSYIRVHPDRAFEFDVTGTTRTTTRWVKVKRFLGTETHPVNFIYGSNVFTGQEFYQYGNVYKSYGNGTVVVRDANDTATADVTTGGQRTFTWTGGNFNNASATNASSVVGDLSLGVAMLVHEIDNTAAVVESYDAGTSSGNLISAGANVAVTEIANNVLITATGTNASTFFLEDGIGRYYKLDYPDGVCYCRVVSGFGNNVEALIRTPVPRNATTGEFQNAGVAVSFSEGAWYDNNYPKEVAKFERRRIYGGTPTHPNFVFFSKVDDETDFAPTEGDKEVLDTSGISYALSNVNSSIRWMLAAKELVIGTSRGIFRVIPNQYEFSISPKTIRIELVDEVNCKGEAHMIGTSIFFPDESDTKLMEYKYDGQIQSSNANDLSKFIYPTFIEDQIKRITVQENPQPRIWVLTEGGLLYILSYQRQEEYYAWSKVDHGTVVEDITCVREGYASGNDKVVIATRENTSLQFETLFSPKNSTAEPTEYLDGSFTHTVTDISTTISSGTLTITLGSTNNYNNGQSLSVVANGVYYGEHSLSKPSGNGTITIASWSGPTTGAVTFVIGRRYTGTLQPMYPTWDGQSKPAFGADEIRVISTRLHVIKTSKFKLGIGGSFETITLPSTNYTGFDKERPVVGSTFGVDRIPEIKQDEPASMTLTAIVTKTDLTG